MRAQHFDVGDNKQIILALDQAGWHTSGVHPSKKAITTVSKVT
ncbi:MAG: hypothetical protein SAK29_36805 [Scytonema sp. PMC 1069.18]|nr:hypothetical protein [Scytonema sp. PMC 1069.18]MEC4882547.1 hypothetical protein [Scytonema sp. PMC 1070.18]